MAAKFIENRAAVCFVSGRVAGWTCCAGAGPAFSSFGIKTPFRGGAGHPIPGNNGGVFILPKYTPPAADSKEILWNNFGTQLS